MSEEILNKLDKFAEGVKSAQDVADRNKDRLDALDEKQIDKIAEDVTKNLEDVQKLEAKQKAIEENSKKLETILCNMDNVKKAGNVEAEKKARDEFIRYLRKGDAISEESVEHITKSIVDNNFVGITDEKRKMIQKDWQVQVDPDGGYFVRPEISNTMITRIFETSPVRQYATSVNISSDALEFIIDDEEDDAGWVGETDSRPTTTNGQIGKLLIYAHELYAKPRATQKMIDDAGFDIEAWIQSRIVSKFTRLENSAFVVGNGNKKPRGFLTYPAWAVAGVYERGRIEQRTSSTSGDFEADDVKYLQNDLFEDYQPNAIWMMQRKTFGNIITKKDAEDRYLLDPNSFKVGDTKILLGSSVVFMADIPAVAANALAIAYGDLGISYTIVDRIGIRMLRDPYSDKPYIQYYTTKRVGGDVTNYQGLKILKIAP